MIKRIHVNQHVIKHNRKTGENLPFITVKEGNRNRYGNEVKILGPSTIVDGKNNPLSCGAVVWIETESDIEIINETNYENIRNKMKSCEI